MSLEEKRQMQLHCIYIIHPGYSGVRVTRFLSFVHLTIVLFVLLRFAEFDYSFGIFKLFLQISRDKNYIVFSDDSVEMLDI